MQQPRDRVGGRLLSSGTNSRNLGRGVQGRGRERLGQKMESQEFTEGLKVLVRGLDLTL